MDILGIINVEDFWIWKLKTIHSNGWNAELNFPDISENNNNSSLKKACIFCRCFIKEY